MNLFGETKVSTYEFKQMYSISRKNFQSFLGFYLAKTTDLVDPNLTASLIITTQKVTYKIACAMDFTSFPVDTQVT